MAQLLLPFLHFLPAVHASSAANPAASSPCLSGHKFFCIFSAMTGAMRGDFSSGGG